MKKIIASFVLALIVCSSSFAVKAWEFEFKGLGGYNHVSEYALGEKNTLDDFLVGGGIDITRCWSNYVGIDFSLTYLQPMFNDTGMWLYNSVNFDDSAANTTFEIK